MERDERAFAALFSHENKKKPSIKNVTLFRDYTFYIGCNFDCYILENKYVETNSINGTFTEAKVLNKIAP